MLPKDFLPHDGHLKPTALDAPVSPGELLVAARLLMSSDIVGASRRGTSTC
jgi:hypothetical protein